MLVQSFNRSLGKVEANSPHFLLLAMRHPHTPNN